MKYHVNLAYAHRCFFYKETPGYEAVYELRLYDPFNIALHYITTKFISKYSIKRALDTEMMNSYQLFKCRLYATYKNFTLIYHLNFLKGRCMTSEEVQKISGEVQNDLRGGADLPTPPLKIWT
jgi:hypothetical protein